MARAAGGTWAFACALGIVLVWAACGPIFGFSDTWQLVINTGTTIVTFLMVFLIQRSQNKDAEAVHLKLNEIVAALEGASNRLVVVEDLSEGEIRTLHEHYRTLSEASKRDVSLTRSHSIEEAEARHRAKTPARSLVILAAALSLLALPAAAAQVPVLHREGTAHGFLVLRDQRGAPIADGHLLQGDKDGGVETKLAFRFHDGSLSEETALFTQERTFRLIRYELVQRGPAFATDLTATLDARTGRYSVRARERKSGDETKDEGVLKLPSDTSNGLVPILVKNLPRGGAVHIVAFLPKPKLLEVSIDVAGEGTGALGTGSLRVARYVVKPQLGALTKAVAKLLGKMPPDTRLWVSADEAPAFLRFEGSLAVGLPAWRIESALPSLRD